MPESGPAGPAVPPEAPPSDPRPHRASVRASELRRNVLAAAAPLRSAAVVPRVRESLVGRAAARYLRIDGYDRALALATQAFVAIVPMLIVLIAALPADSRDAIRDWLAHEGFLGPNAYSAVGPLTRPSQWSSGIVVGAVLLVVSVVGFARTLQRLYHAAWDLPPPGWRGLGPGLAGAAGVVAGAMVLLLSLPLLRDLGSAVLLTGLVEALAATALWLAVLRLLLAGRVSWRALLPGAVITGVGQSLVMLLSGLIVPVFVERESARYGLIGGAFVLVSWLVVLGILLVVAAVISAELGGPDGSAVRTKRHEAR
jgi:membrane protein